MDNQRLVPAGETSADAWARLREATGPLSLDCAVRVTRRGESAHNHLVVDVATDSGEALGMAHVFTGEWYPGYGRGGGFSHYLRTLDQALRGLEKRGDANPELRLQVLKAVDTGQDEPYVVLLKFIIAPEWAVTGAELEQVYSCPLSGFFQHFVGVDRDVRRAATSPGFTMGNAIHRGYNSAMRAVFAGENEDTANSAYRSAVLAAWTEDFLHLVNDDAKSPGVLYRTPAEAQPEIVRRSLDALAEGEAQLFQERLFFSPSRGLSGKADRFLRRPDGAQLYEIKTSSTGFLARDPRTGREAPGGIQALSYHEIIRTLDGTPPRTWIEEFKSNHFSETRLEEHPVIVRSEANVTDINDRYVDLLAQSRNVAYLASSGLLSGYDRLRIDAMGRAGQKLDALGGDFDLYAQSPPCRTCPASARGICESARGQVSAPLRGFFRYVPDQLYTYWAWYHGQILAEERSAREAMSHLVATPIAQLERDEGITIAGVRPIRRSGRSVTFQRSTRIETRLREDDRVLITPADRPPGELYSLEGTMSGVGFDSVTINVDEVIEDGQYRVDQVGMFGRVAWQIQGLTDFLITSVAETGVAGRDIGLEEIPRLAQAVLGIVPPAETSSIEDTASAVLEPPYDDLVGALNEDQRAAFDRVMALGAGEAALIQGPPGTGKTTLIAAIARAVAAREFWRDDMHPVLILANTHRACNEVVAKISARYPDLRPYLVRVGRRLAGMEPSVREQLVTERVNLPEEMGGIELNPDGISSLYALTRRAKAQLGEAAIFVGTLASARAPELRGRQFSMVIVDETGQATEPATLQALRHLPAGYRGRLVLIGDHKQLPPVVREEAGQRTVPEELLDLGFLPDDGLRVSLFERLARRWPEHVQTLKTQYRMNGAISGLVSETFYDGVLRPGNAAVAGQRLAPAAVPPQFQNFTRIWDETPVVFIDTSRDGRARDQVSGPDRDESRANHREAEIIAEVVTAYLHGLEPAERVARAGEIGLISAYRRQNTLIRQLLARRNSDVMGTLRLDTVDRFQGGEKDVIIVSLVASNPRGVIGRLQADWRRFNVAVSRARKKLILVGNRRTYEQRSIEAEALAKARFQVFFAGIDRLSRDAEATIIESAPLMHSR